MTELPETIERFRGRRGIQVYVDASIDVHPHLNRNIHKVERSTT